MDANTAIVTGASSGLGAGLARRLAERGVHVFALARRAEKLEALREEAGDTIEPVVADVRDTAALVETMREIDARCGGVDLVIANAGIGGMRRATKLTWEEWVAPVLEVNVLGAFATLTALLPRMVERDRGHLVGVSSIAAMRGLPGTGAYSASKAALSTFLETLRVDLKGTGLSVTTIEPGFVRTPLTEGNPRPMPFLMDLEPAVDAMVRAIERKEALCTFPWQLSTVGKVGRLVPRFVYERLV
ncbi:MAG: SDR family NAD(P)-dependent oxidoreductase [Deltaproteobacteria bacterium]|nr:MAG: SDR family NAD(P)-dependent oxidoreductase [Deltaproteobacteria bacterium]